MRIAVLALAGVAVAGALAAAQTTPAIPIRQLAPASAKSATTVGSVYGVRELRGGGVIVNDVVRRRLMVFDASLATFSLAADSAGESGTTFPEYGTRALIAYLGDSTLFVDNNSRTLLVVDPAGKISRAMAHPKSVDFGYLNVVTGGVAAVDPRGGLFYQGGRANVKPPKPGAANNAAPPRTRDTLAIVRADMETRVIDTVATIVAPRAVPIATAIGANGKMTGSVRINPVPGVADNWAVLPDGTLAILRAQDYHIDWVFPDGKRTSSPKLAFDWRRLTDADKQAKIDSIKHMIDSVNASGIPYGRMISGQTNAEGVSRTDTVIPKVDYTPIAEIADYVPPFRSGAVKPDMDGNVWILPSTSSQARGGLLYDVVNKKGELFERVQLPKDRDIAGFGRGGVVYLSWYQAPNSYRIERTKIGR